MGHPKDEAVDTARVVTHLGQHSCCMTQDQLNYVVGRSSRCLQLLCRLEWQASHALEEFNSAVCARRSTDGVAFLFLCERDTDVGVKMVDLRCRERSGGQVSGANVFGPPSASLTPGESYREMTGENKSLVNSAKHRLAPRSSVKANLLAVWAKKYSIHHPTLCPLPQLQCPPNLQRIQLLKALTP